MDDSVRLKIRRLKKQRRSSVTMHLVPQVGRSSEHPCVNNNISLWCVVGTDMQSDSDRMLLWDALTFHDAARTNAQLTRQLYSSDMTKTVPFILPGSRIRKLCSPFPSHMPAGAA